MKPYFSFQWHITDECDQRCKHCYIFSENSCKKPDTMSWKQMQDTFSNCLDFCEVYGRLPYFYIMGGDPILHPDFWKLLGLMKQHDIPFTILGNPFHLNDEVCRRMKEYGCQKYQLSLDGMRETHDWFRRPGSFDITLEKIGCINRAGIRSVIMTTVSGANIDEVPDIIDASVAAGANVFAFARYCPTSGEKDVGIEPLRYRALLETCDRKFKAYEAAGCKTYFNKKDHLWTLYEYETGTFKIPETAQEGMIYGGCNCGNCHLTLLPNGDSEPCCLETFENEALIRSMLERQKEMRIPSELLPVCPHCGKPMTVNLRSDEKFVEDGGWIEAAQRYEDFLRTRKDRKILLVELGVGYNTPVIIKYPFWRMTAQNPQATYACINEGAAHCPKEIEGQSICINGDIGPILSELKKFCTAALRRKS